MVGRVSDLVAELAKVDDRPPATLTTVARQCRLLGIITQDTPGRGPGAAKVSDAATLLLAANVSENPLAGARLVQRYRALVPTIGWIKSSPGRTSGLGVEYERVDAELASVPAMARLMSASSFGEALECLIEDAPVFAYLNMLDPNSEVDGIWEDTVTFQRKSSVVIGEIRIGSGATCGYALNISNRPPPLKITPRKVEITIGLKLFLNLHGALKSETS